jgi:hypothetical protein
MECQIALSIEQILPSQLAKGFFARACRKCLPRASAALGQESKRFGINVPDSELFWFRNWEFGLRFPIEPPSRSG